MTGLASDIICRHYIAIHIASTIDEDVYSVSLQVCDDITLPQLHS